MNYPAEGLVQRTVNADDRRSYSSTSPQPARQRLAQANKAHGENEKRLAEAVAPLTVEQFGPHCSESWARPCGARRVPPSKLPEELAATDRYVRAYTDSRPSKARGGNASMTVSLPQAFDPIGIPRAVAA